MSTDIEIAVLSASFLAQPGHEADLAAALAKYVVLTRHLPNCRNVDLVVSTTESGRFLVLEKWESDADARSHVDSAVMLDMANEVVGFLAEPPNVDLWDTISAHDLR